jgi:hypothetical protein
MGRGRQSRGALGCKAENGPPCGRRPLTAVKAINKPPTPRPVVRPIPVASIRMDGGAQHRIAPDPNIVKEYAELMQTGVQFPPISVRYDGRDHWLSDGFQRIAAAKLAEFLEIRAEVRPGTREDAQWDSYAANATHGLRRTATETEKVIQLALQHPNAAEISNVQIAKHLHIPESTVRYWRKKLSSQTCEDSAVRTVTRGHTSSELNTTNLGKRTGGRAKRRRDLRSDLATAKERSSPTVRVLLNIIEHWVLSPKCDSAELLNAIEGFLWTHRAEFAEPRAWPLPSAAPAQQQNSLAAGAAADSRIEKRHE